jgi:hypothetical protein
MKRGSDSRNEKRQAALRVAPVPGQLGRYAAMRRLRRAGAGRARALTEARCLLSGSGLVVRPLAERLTEWAAKCRLVATRRGPGRRAANQPALGGAARDRRRRRLAAAAWPPPAGPP